tara:strand:- start:365 stop:601 length:237 start_codon:yes stop_codon:yes gene_type:complete
MEIMSKSDVIQILKILKERNKKDLITKMRIVFEDILDDDWSPPTKKMRREEYSDSEGSAEEEEEYIWEMDEYGLMSLV